MTSTTTIRIGAVTLTRVEIDAAPPAYVAEVRVGSPYAAHRLSSDAVRARRDRMRSEVEAKLASMVSGAQIIEWSEV